MTKFLHDDDNDNAKAIAIPLVFSENSPAKNESPNSSQLERCLFTK